MKRIGNGILVLGGSMLLTGLLAGCGGDDNSAQSAPPTTAPVAVASPAGAPTFGTQSGMGFSTGDALHSDGAGSGLMGYNGTGKMGTSSAITDAHTISKPSFATTEPVLPAP